MSLEKKREEKVRRATVALDKAKQSLLDLFDYQGYLEPHEDAAYRLVRDAVTHMSELRFEKFRRQIDEYEKSK